jgi:peptidoglycan/xylan/chitin deacetylase (PgdA/CDA1 family)
MFAYVLIIILGYIFPRWGMFADVIDEALPGRQLVALTFDDGPDESSTPYVLETLAKYEAKATFFLIGRKAEKQPRLVASMIEQGHEVGYHGYSHSRLTAFRSAAWMKEDLKKARDVLSPWVPNDTRWFRPPIGHVTPRLAAVARELGFVILCWTIRGLDGLPGVSKARVVRRVIPQLRDGAIIALHDAFETESGVPAGAEALSEILDAIKNAGLRSVTLSELLK